MRTLPTNRISTRTSTSTWSSSAAHHAGWLLLAVAAVTATTSTGCRDQQSFIVVTVESVDATPISGVVELTVVATNGNNTKQLTYPVPAGQSPLTITGVLDPVTSTIGKTFSVSFSPSYGDDLMVAVDAHDAKQCRIGHGTGQTTIKKGGVGTVMVLLDHTSGPCAGDAGTDAGTTFPGCDPAAKTCGASMTCAVNCSALQGQCVAAGSNPGGSTCTRNTDCAPGTQCFNYTGPSCAVGVCLMYCKDNNDCAGMMGTGSVCQGKVPCGLPDGGGTVLTSYHTCTFGCDPRGTATMGCPGGLHCFLVDSMDQVDCACTEATRTHTEGQACTRGQDCAAGLICDQSTFKCQKICKIGVAADCLPAQTCTMLTNDQLYGVCLP